MTLHSRYLSAPRWPGNVIHKCPQHNWSQLPKPREHEGLHLSSKQPPPSTYTTCYHTLKVVRKQNYFERKLFGKVRKTVFQHFIFFSTGCRMKWDWLICLLGEGRKGPKDDPIPQKTHFVTCCSGNSTRTSRSQRRSWSQSSPNSRTHPHHSKRVAGFCFQALLMFDKLYRLEVL